MTVSLLLPRTRARICSHTHTITNYQTSRNDEDGHRKTACKRERQCASIPTVKGIVIVHSSLRKGKTIHLDFNGDRNHVRLVGALNGQELVQVVVSEFRRHEQETCCVARERVDIQHGLGGRSSRSRSNATGEWMHARKETPE